ncbi:hypothetical protein [Endozoicomonas sp. 8E]|uniref:hypothetical protein n=1 Tax=Endozoicomonas sp. 8E TaxID=3035692 RepID=UPI00293936FD|nr:hypothetical protein [Endozoicomonas sp. 8E]WOG27095.1 hypothetical protein P6910_21470 [Endozoicomonas sp. 8E]
MSVIGRAEPWTGRLTVEFDQNADFATNQGFSIKRELNTFSVNPSEITETSSLSEPDAPTDKKRQRSNDYRVKTGLIESLSSQFLYTTNLLVAFELILTTKGSPPRSPPYSWLLVEVIVAVVWLLKSSWNHDSALYTPSKRQTLFILTQEDHPFADITMMFGSGHNQQQSQQQYQPSESSAQNTPQANAQTEDYVTGSLYSGSGGGNGGPQQYLHTVGLNCFVYPCHGACRLRSSSGNKEPDESNFEQPCIPTLTSETITEMQSSQSGATCSISPVGPLNDDESMAASACLVPEGKPPKVTSHYQQVLPDHKSRVHTVQKICMVKVVGADGRARPCGMVCKNSQALSDHKRGRHRGRQTCKVTIIVKDGLQQPCGKIFFSRHALTKHKKSIHNGQQICGLTVIGEKDQPQPCGVVCKNAKTLSTHKNRYHSGQKTCHFLMVGENGQQRQCGKVCKNARILMDHKRSAHSGQQICDSVLLREDGQQQPCGKVCNNARALFDHRRRAHSEQKICDEPLVREDDQTKSCGTVCKNSRALSSHKKKYHSRK